MRNIPSAPLKKRHDAEVAFQIRLASQDDAAVTMTATLKQLEALLRDYFCAGWDAAKRDSVERAMDGVD